MSFFPCFFFFFKHFFLFFRFFSVFFSLTPHPHTHKTTTTTTTFGSLEKKPSGWPWLTAARASQGGDGSDGCPRCFGTSGSPSLWSLPRPCIIAGMQGRKLRTKPYGDRRRQAQGSGRRLSRRLPSRRGCPRRLGARTLVCLSSRCRCWLVATASTTPLSAALCSLWLQTGPDARHHGRYDQEDTYAPRIWQSFVRCSLWFDSGCMLR